MEIITSADNARIKKYASLKMKKYRDRYGLFIIEEKHMIEEALSKKMVDTLIVREGCSNPFDIEPIYVTDNIIKKLSDNVSLNDYIAVCKMPVNNKLQGNRFMVMENVQDPGNIGTIIRTACSFGYDAVILCEGCADLYNEKTVKATQGAIFHIPVLRLNISDTYSLLKENGCKVIATALRNSVPIKECEKYDKYAIVVGNEGQGLSEYAQSNADAVVKIEMDKFESLNVAIAAAITMYYFKY